jgi:FkbM family methyltransferase
MDIEDLIEIEPSNYFEHCYMVENCKKQLKFIPENIVNKYKRKIFINLGSQSFETSTKWFKDNYEHMKNFDEWKIYCFECDKSKIGETYKKYSNIKVYNKAIYNYDGFIDITGLGTMGRVLSADGKSGNLKDRSTKIECIDFMKFIKENFSKDDFILVKCDIEGSEFSILPEIIENSEYIKELFIEFHYNRWMNPGKEKQEWIKAGKPRFFNIKHNKRRHPHFTHTFIILILYIKN